MAEAITDRFTRSSPAATRDCMVFGMAATRKVTVTLSREQVEAIRRLVSTGEARSMSGFVQYAVGVALDDVAGWDAMLAEALRATGGELTAAERDWADGVLTGSGPDSSEAA